MDIKLKSVLLIDDDEAINFINKLIINKINVFNEIITTKNGLEALNYLKKIYKEGETIPELIFLDLNMPIMDGWNFLEEYKKLDFIKLNQTKLVILTSSHNPDDYEKSKKIKEVNNFTNKPLTTLMLKDIVAEFFE